LINFEIVAPEKKTSQGSVAITRGLLSQLPVSAPKKGGGWLVQLWVISKWLQKVMGKAKKKTIPFSDQIVISKSS